MDIETKNETFAGKTLFIMLEYLHIRNLALIDDMELEFSDGMNVLTGETGAGKSFILKAINFLLGDRIPAQMVRPGKEKAQVEALFVQPDGELTLRRELNSATGRSRFYINGNLGSQENVRKLGPKLLVHTSQHGQQRLLQPGFQASLVDSELDRPDLLAEKDRILKGIRETIARRDSLRTRFRELAARRELLELHLSEIEKVNPLPGEEEALEEQRILYRKTEHLRENYQHIQQLLLGEETGLLDQLSRLEQGLDILAQNDDSCSSELEATSTFRQMLVDLSRRLRKPPLDLPDVNPEEIESRLYELAQLKRKLRRTLPEILSLRDEIRENLSFLDACTLDLRHIEKTQKSLQDELSALMTTLNPLRRAAAEQYVEKLQTELLGLGFSKYLKVIAEFSPHEYFPGCHEDRVRLLWAPNPGQMPQPLDRIASGGELSRFMLAVVSLQHSDDSSTLIFDEVDAGVGGITLNRVAEHLEALATRRQMLLITHWPRLASRASRHFQVSKHVIDAETFTVCTRLEGVEREDELKRMSGIENCSAS